jgi:hypothetical protein
VVSLRIHGLADALARVEEDEEDPAAGRARVRELVEERYTLPS